MTAGQLLALLAALYLIDAIRLVGADDLWLVSWGARFRVAAPGIVLDGILPTAEFLRGGRRLGTGNSGVDPSRDFEALRARWLSHRPLVPLGRVAGLLLFICTFVGLPLSVAPRFPAGPSVAGVIVAIGVLHVTMVGLATVMLWRGGCDRRAILHAVTPLALVPIASMRALSAVSTRLYADADSLALAALVLDDATFLGIVRRELGNAGSVSSCPEGSRTASASWESGLRRLVKKRGLPAPDAPPKQMDPTSARYCPICWREYLERATTCSDCGIDLKRFTDVDRASS